MTSTFAVPLRPKSSTGLLIITAALAIGCASNASSDNKGSNSDGSPDSKSDAGRGNQADTSSAGAPEAGFTTWTYNDKPMGMYIPASTGKPLPVLMYLHACHNDPVYENYWIIQAANDVEPTAVFLPTAPPAIDFTCADWGGTYDQALRPNMIDALAELDRLIRDNGFDSKRQYIYGESMGGEGVYRLLMDFPTRFAGAVSAAGYTKDKGAAQMAQTPLWIFHGDADGTSPVDADRTIYQSITAAGGTKVKYTEYPGLDHVPGIEQARSEPGLFEWLLAQHR